MIQNLFTTFYAGIYTFLSGASSYHLIFEAVLVICIVWLFLKKSYKPAAKFELSEKIKDELIAEWKPEPLVPDTPQDHYALNPKYIEGKMGKYMRIDGVDYLNLATMNFLGFVGDKRIEEVAKKTIFKYGVGSCGPRGFYGTVDVHLDLEKEISDFMGCEETVLYSYGFATIASAIPAYAKKGDIIFCDKGANFAIQKGLQASRSRVEWFEHNDMNDLERLLLIQADKDKQNPKKAKVTRRFLVVEGIYLNTGSICPLKRLIEFKWKYKVRIFVDESVSFGILGKKGAGVTEHFGVPMEEVDMIMASLEYGMASTGGFCCGRTFVVDHQRLSGVGYCFSASLPPLLATAAGEALKIMQAEPERLQRLSGITKKFKSELVQKCSGTSFSLEGSELSPIFHLKYSSANGVVAAEVLDRVVDLVFGKSIALTRARYLENEEAFYPQPSIRIALNSELTDVELDKAISAIADAIEMVERK